MWKERFLFLFVIAILVVILLRPISVEEPVAVAEPPVTREFMLWLPTDTQPHEWPNFRSHVSFYLMALPGGAQTDKVTIWDHASQPVDYRGTSWWSEKTEFWHVTKGGSLAYKASWKGQPPPSGARAESSSITGDIYRIRPRKAADAGTKEEIWEFTEEASGIPVFVGKGQFSK